MSGSANAVFNVMSIMPNMKKVNVQLKCFSARLAKALSVFIEGEPRRRITALAVFLGVLDVYAFFLAVDEELVGDVFVVVAADGQQGSFSPSAASALEIFASWTHNSGSLRELLEIAGLARHKAPFSYGFAC